MRETRAHGLGKVTGCPGMPVNLVKFYSRCRAAFKCQWAWNMTTLDELSTPRSGSLAVGWGSPGSGLRAGHERGLRQYERCGGNRGPVGVDLPGRDGDRDEQRAGHER